MRRRTTTPLWSFDSGHARIAQRSGFRSFESHQLPAFWAKGMHFFLKLEDLPAIFRRSQPRFPTRCPFTLAYRAWKKSLFGKMLVIAGLALVFSLPGSFVQGYRLDRLRGLSRRCANESTYLRELSAVAKDLDPTLSVFFFNQSEVEKQHAAALAASNGTYREFKKLTETETSCPPLNARDWTKFKALARRRGVTLPSHPLWSWSLNPTFVVLWNPKFTYAGLVLLYVVLRQRFSLLEEEAEASSPSFIRWDPEIQ